MSEKLFEEFGKILMEYARDEGIKYWDWIFVDKVLNRWLEKYRNVLDTFTEEQLAMLHNVGPYIIDAVFHSLLLILENEDWITISLEKDGETVQDIRKVATGDLQGYIFEWAEKYSTKRLSHEP